MKKNIPIHLQEIIFGSSDPTVSKKISRLVGEGKIKKLTSRVYSANLEESNETIVKRHLFTIIGNLYPTAVLSHRSALEFKPTKADIIFLTYKYTAKVKLPGITLQFLKGEDAIVGDNRIAGELYAAQLERAILENLQVSRKKGEVSKILPIEIIEERLEQIIKINGEKELNKFRDRSRVIALKLHMEKEFVKLNKIISALLSTYTSKILHSPTAIARSSGLPFDGDRIRLFEILYERLREEEFKVRMDRNLSDQSFRNFAFFESYFSNYIEGTKFEIEEAKSIIRNQRPLPSRNSDSHDILGTYHLVSNKTEMNIVPEHPEDLLVILKYRHEVLMAARPRVKPGYFKDKNNFAGQTAFVDYKLVKGTLIKGFEYYKGLRQAFARAAFIMFLVSEVHPFLDGNGRVARIMMNAELVNLGEVKIIISTVFRDDYIVALRRLIRKQDPDPYVRMLIKAHEFSATIYGQNLFEMEKKLRLSNAFFEHTEAKLRIIKDVI